MTTIRKSYTLKRQPKFTTTPTIKGKSTISYKMQDHDPIEDIYDIHQVPSDIEEINDPTPDIDGGDYHTHYDYDTTAKSKKKVVYHCGGDDEYIEVPGGSDTVPYTDDEGNQYEIPLDDLIEYDGDDGEIQYTSGKRGKKSLKLSHKLQDRVPPVIMAKQNIQLAMFQQFGPRAYC